MRSLMEVNDLISLKS